MHVYFPPRLIHTPDPVNQQQFVAFMHKAMEAYASGGAIVVSDEDSFMEAVKIVMAARGFPEGEQDMKRYREWRQRRGEWYAGLDGCPNIRDAIAQSQDPPGGLSECGE